MNRLLSLVAACGGIVLLLNGCGDPLRPRAQLPVFLDTLTAFALTGTPLTAPSALHVPTLAVLPPRNVPGSLEVEFEVAFDIDDAGRVRLIPAPRIGLSTRRIGFQDLPQSFQDVLEAPRTGYVRDTVWIATPGTVVTIEAEVSICGSFSLSPFMYNKLVVDSVRTDSRLIYFRSATDPNCGFRSFAEGIPER